MLPLATRAARTRFVPPTLRVLRRVDVHELRRRSICTEEIAHRFHRRPDVSEELLVARTEVVQAGVAVGRRGEAILRTPAVAGEPHVALQTVRGQSVALR